MQEKSVLRKNLLLERSRLGLSEIKVHSEKMCLHLASWSGERQFSRIFLFHPFRQEPDLTSLVRSQKVPVAMPVVVSRSDMHFYHVDPSTTFVENKWGILEPVVASAEPVIPDQNSLVVIPALAADRTGHRLGYGRGFYDRFLAASKATRMVVVYSDFVVDRLPAGDHDVQVHFILTEKGVIEV